MRILLVVVPTARASVVAAAPVAGWVLAAGTQRSEGPVVRAHAQVTGPLVAVSASGVQILSPVVGSDGVMLCTATGLLVALRPTAAKYLPSERGWLARACAPRATSTDHHTLLV